MAEAFALVAEAAVAALEAAGVSVADEDEDEASVVGEVEDSHKQVVSFDSEVRSVDTGSLVVAEGHIEQCAAAAEESARVVWRWGP